MNIHPIREYFNPVWTHIPLLAQVLFRLIANADDHISRLVGVTRHTCCYCTLKSLDGTADVILFKQDIGIGEKHIGHSQTLGCEGRTHTQQSIPIMTDVVVRECTKATVVKTVVVKKRQIRKLELRLQSAQPTFHRFENGIV